MLAHGFSDASVEWVRLEFHLGDSAKAVKSRCRTRFGLAFGEQEWSEGAERKAESRPQRNGAAESQTEAADECWFRALVRDERARSRAHRPRPGERRAGQWATSRNAAAVGPGE